MRSLCFLLLVVLVGTLAWGQTIVPTELKTVGVLGITPGQTARLNVFGPPFANGLLPPAAPIRACSATLSFVDPQNNHLKDMSVLIAPGQSTFLDLNMDVDVPATTARLQIRGVVAIQNPDPVFCNAIPTVELIDNATKRTTAILSQTNVSGLTRAAATFTAIVPCRVADTRTNQGKSGDFGPPFLSHGATRTFAVPSSSCGIPSNATAYAVNLTALPHGMGGYLTTWPSGDQQPLASTLNWFSGGVVANSAIISAGTNGAISVFVSDDADLIIDINGYFTASSE